MTTPSRDTAGGVGWNIELQRSQLRCTGRNGRCTSAMVSRVTFDERFLLVLASMQLCCSSCFLDRGVRAHALTTRLRRRGVRPPAPAAQPELAASLGAELLDSAGTRDDRERDSEPLAGEFPTADHRQRVNGGCASRSAQVRQAPARPSRGADAGASRMPFPPRFPDPPPSGSAGASRTSSGPLAHPAPPKTGCPQPSESCCDRTTVEVFHPHSINNRLTAHPVRDQQRGAHRRGRPQPPATRARRDRVR